MHTTVEPPVTGDGPEVTADATDSAARPMIGAPAPHPRAGLLTSGLVVALLAVTALGLAVVDRSATPTTGWSIPFWGIAALTFGAAFLVFHVEFRRENYTFTFGELVLVVGVFFASPVHLVVGRVLGEVVYLVGRERQRPRKLVVNLAVVAAESVALLYVQQTLLSPLDVRQPLSWVVVLAAVIIAELVGFAAIALAVRWHGGPLTFRSIVTIGLVTAPANTSLAVVACILLDVQPAAVPLLACVAAFLLAAYRAYSSLRQRHESLSLLYEFTHLVSGAREPDEVLDAMLTQAKELLRAERAEFWLALPEGDYRRHVVDDTSHTRNRQRLPAGLDGLGELLVRSRHALLVAEGASAPHERAVLDALGAGDALVAPITESGELIGFVAVANRLSGLYTFDVSDAKLFGTLASHAGVALQNGRLIVRLHEQARQREHEARHDALTGLPNRVMFADRLQARLAVPHRDVAIALMDLDGFKDINDTLGHAAGDHVLVEIGRRLRAALPDDVLAARLGGDEFALLAAPGTSHADVARACRAVRDAIAAPMSIEHVTVTMGVSIGIAVAPMDGDDPDTLVRRADVAMYTAKSAHDDDVCFYDPARDENTPRRLVLAHDLRAAIAGGQLHVRYQPKISLVDSTVVGVECLCRWEHPELGTVLPDEFIPLAERTGAIADLTAFMLRDACMRAAGWRAEGRSWSAAVNISVRDLLDVRLVDEVAGLLRDAGLPPDALILEITESQVMSEPVRSTSVLASLAELGVRLSIDDFGTGYSSLAYLQRLPVQEMKVDRSFVAALASDPGAAAVVRSVIQLAENLGLSVVAEGVEDEVAADQLRRMGCDEAQGHLFAPALTAEELVRFADAHDGRRTDRPVGPPPVRGVVAVPDRSGRHFVVGAEGRVDGHAVAVADEHDLHRVAR